MNWRSIARTSASVAVSIPVEKVLTDPDTARRLREEDDVMDGLHRHLFTVLMDRDWKHGVPAAVDVALLSRFYERFADHAVQIGRRVVFQVTGALPPEQKVATY